MTTTLPLRCACGAMRGVLDVVPGEGRRVVCYCDDCQAFARFLGRDDVLDAQGGSDLYQTFPAHVRITEGAERLACVRLTSKGLLRFHTSCCRTPIANTVPSARVAFIGLSRRFIADAEDGRPADAVLGPPVLRTQGRYAKGGVPAGAEARPGLGTIVGSIVFLARGMVARAAHPSPLFDRATGAPRVVPRVLTASEREALREASRPTL